MCWVVPRDSLRLQAEEAFADPAWRARLGHALSVRAADNTPDPSRGLAGYVTTYQGVAAAPGLHLAEFRRHRTLLVVDEVHHLPALADTDPVAARPNAGADDDPASAWSQRPAAAVRVRGLRLLLSGTLERADGKGILWLPYRTGPQARTREVALDAPGWAVVGYSRRQALAERAVLPVTFGALDGEASWRDEEGRDVGPHRLAACHPEETTRPALFTALRTGFAEALLREAFLAIRDLRAERRRQRGLAPASAGARPGQAAGGGARPDRGPALPRADPGLAARRPGRDACQLATSDTPRAHEILAAFRLTPEPSILVTVAMAYEGLDAPEVAVVAALTHIRSRPWLEQMVARATRVDPHAGPYATQRALVFHPDDPLFAQFRRRLETEQGTLARRPKPRAGRPPCRAGCWTSCRRSRTASRRSSPTRWRCASTRCGPAPSWRCAARSRRRAGGDAGAALGRRTPAARAAGRDGGGPGGGGRGGPRRAAGGVAGPGCITATTRR